MRRNCTHLALFSVGAMAGWSHHPNHTIILV